MDSFLELEVIPEVDDELQIRIKGSSFGFSGEAYCYVNEDSFLKFAKSLDGFPSKKDQVLSFDTGKNISLSTFELSFTNANSSGHIKVEVIITHVDNCIDSIVKKYSSNFAFVIMPSDLDVFQKSLIKVANYKNIGQIARLCTNT